MGKIFKKETTTCIKCKCQFTPEKQSYYCAPCNDKENIKRISNQFRARLRAESAKLIKIAKKPRLGVRTYFSGERARKF